MLLIISFLCLKYGKNKNSSQIKTGQNGDMSIFFGCVFGILFIVIPLWNDSSA